MASDPDSIELHNLSQQHQDRRSGTDQTLQSTFSTEAAHPEQRADSANAPARTVYDSAPLGDSLTAIRLLDVYEQHDGCEPLIRCKLRVVDLADSPRFTALSYVWGDPAIQETIWCSDKPILVTRNAWQALHRLRNRFAPLTTWIDAVCINQADEGEKVQQIPLMRAIYSSAVHVYIWLGEGNAKTQRAMCYLETGGIPFRRWTKKTLADCSEDGSSDSSWASEIPSGRLALFLLTLHTIWRVQYRFKIYRCSELKQLFSNPWIERIWTWQEVVCAQQPILVSGDLAVSWFSFLCVVQVLEISQSESADLLPPQSEQWLHLAAIWRAFREKQSWSAAPSISAEDTQSVPLATEGQQPMAHAQLVLPMTKRCDALLRVHTSEIARFRAWWICWARFARSIYSKVAIALLVAVWLGWLASTIQRGVYLNSLAAHWIYALLIIVLTPLAYLRAAVMHRVNTSVDWKLGMISQIATRRCSVWKDKYYGIHGIIGPPPANDTGGALGPAPDRQDIYRTMSLDLMSWSKSLDVLLFKSSGPADGDSSWIVDWYHADARWLTYHRTRWVNEHYTGCATPGSDAFFSWDLRSSHRLIVHAVTVAAIDCVIVPGPDEFSKAQADYLQRQLDLHTSFSPGDSPELAKMWSQIGDMLSRALEDDRAIVTTPLPDSFGLAPRDVQIGDIIVLMPGLSVPMVLRLRGDLCYQVVGPAYVNGLMCGEQWTRENRAAAEEDSLGLTKTRVYVTQWTYSRKIRQVVFSSSTQVYLCIMSFSIAGNKCRRQAIWKNWKGQQTSLC